MMHYLCSSRDGSSIQGHVELEDFEPVLQLVYENRSSNGLDLSEPVWFTGADSFSSRRPSMACVASWDYFLTKWGWNK